MKTGQTKPVWLNQIKKSWIGQNELWKIQNSRILQSAINGTNTIHINEFGTS